MKKTILAFVLSALGAAAASWTGTISDATCGKGNADGSDRAKQCVLDCIKGGAAPVFVVGDDVYKFDASSVDKIKSHFGNKVQVNGTLKGGVITVDSVKPAK